MCVRFGLRGRACRQAVAERVREDATRERFTVPKRTDIQKIFIIGAGPIVIGASAEAIRKAEDRQLFKQCMEEIGLESASSGLAHSLDEARAIRDDVGLPCVLRPSFTLGGSGGGIAYNREEFDRMVAYALEL